MSNAQGVTEGSSIWSSADPQEIALNLGDNGTSIVTDPLQCSKLTLWIFTMVEENLPIRSSQKLKIEYLNHDFHVIFSPWLK